MIQPLKYGTNIAFKGNEEVSAEKNKPTLKKRFVDVIKGVNEVTSTTKGAARGIAEGVVATALIGLVGKNIKENKANIFKSAAGVLKDATKTAWNVVKSIPALVTKSPAENIKNVITLPSKFYKNYLKNTKTTAIIATLAGLGVLAFRTIQGKIKANMKNANVDHATKTKHY